MNSDQIFSLSWSHDSKLLAASSVDAYIWDVKNGKLLKTVTGHKSGYPATVEFSPRSNKWAFLGGIREPGKDGFESLGRGGHCTWSPDGQRVAFPDTPAPTLHSLKLKKGESVLHETAGDVKSVSWSPDGTSLVTGD